MAQGYVNSRVLLTLMTVGSNSHSLFICDSNLEKQSMFLNNFLGYLCENKTICNCINLSLLCWKRIKNIPQIVPLAVLIAYSVKIKNIMKDPLSIISNNPSNDVTINNISRSLKSILGLNSEYSSSSESLLTLLNVSIEHQQARFNSLSQSTMNTSTIKRSSGSKQIYKDEELEMYAGQALEIRSETEHETSCKKKKRKRKDSDGKNSNKQDLEIATNEDEALVMLAVQNTEIKPETIQESFFRKKKKKHKDHDGKNSNEFKIPTNKDEELEILAGPNLEIKPATVQENSCKKKKKKHKDRDDKNSNKYELEIPTNKDEELELLTGQNLEINSEIDQEISLKKKKKKHKDRDGINSNTSELEIPTITDVFPKKHKKRKHNRSSISEELEVLAGQNLEIKPATVQENSCKKKKKKHQDRDDKNSNKYELEIPTNKDEELEPLAGQNLEINSEIDQENSLKKKKKKHKDRDGINSNTSELEIPTNKDEELELLAGQNLEINSEIDQDIFLKKKKKKHKDRDGINSNTSELEIPTINDVFPKNHKKRKHNHSSISEIEDNEVSENKLQKIKKKKHTEIENIARLKSCSPEHGQVLNDSIISPKISKKDGENLKLSTSEIMKTPKLNTKKKPNKSSSKTRKNIIVDSVKIRHKKLYLTPTVTKSENNENEDEEEAASKIKVMNFINEALDTALEKKQLNDQEMSVLNDLQILVPWELPESHTIETRLSHPTAKQYRQFKELDFPMKSGPYNKEEDQIIKDNWEEFCRDHDLKISPLVFFPVEGEHRSLLPTDQRIKFVRYLGKGLKHRTLSSVYNRFQLLFRPYKKGKFTPEEDNIILTFIENSNTPNKYSALSTVLNRGRELIKKRHQVLKLDDEKLSWNMSLLQDLVNNLLEVTGKNNVDDLKEFSIEAAHWQEIEKKMKIPAPKIKRKWAIYVYPRLFVDEYRTLNEIREKLIDILDHSKADDRKKINWNNIAQNFDGMTVARLYKIFLDMLALCGSEAEKTNFRDTVICLKEMLPNMRLKDKALSKFVHCNGQLFDTKILEPVVTF